MFQGEKLLGPSPQTAASVQEEEILSFAVAQHCLTSHTGKKELLIWLLRDEDLRDLILIVDKVIALKDNRHLWNYFLFLASLPDPDG